MSERVRLEPELKDLVYSLHYPDGHRILGKGLRRMKRILSGKENIDGDTLRRLTEMFFRSGHGIYIGIESVLPSEFIDIYPSWLDIHSKFLKNLEESRRILIIKSQTQLFNDKLINSANFYAYVEWHETNKAGIYYVLDERAQEIMKKYELESPTVALWKNMYAIVFVHSERGVKIHTALKGSKRFSNIQKYALEISETAEEVKPQELMLIPPPLARNWKGYTGSSRERVQVHEFIHTLLEKYENHRGVILDVAAGIGNEAIYLLESNFTVEINEIDPTFCGIIKENIDNNNSLKEKGITSKHLRIHQTPWSSLRRNILPGSVSAILALGNDLCMVTEDGEAERMKCIEEFYKILIPGGILIIDERNFSRIREKLMKGESPSGRSVMYPGNNLDCEIKQLENNHKLRFRFSKRGDFVGDIDVTCLEKGELKALLENTGFDPIGVYSDLIRETTPNHDAEFYTYVATKPNSLVPVRQIPARKPLKLSRRKTSIPAIFLGGEPSVEEPEQWGVIGKSDGKLVGFDLDAPHIIFVCGTMGSGKGYTIGVLCEMLLSLSIPKLSEVSKKATIIVLHKPRQDERSEFWSMKNANNDETEVQKLKKDYGVDPQNVISEEDVRIFVDPLACKNRAEEFRKEYGFKDDEKRHVFPICVDRLTLTGDDWGTILSTASSRNQEYVERVFSIVQDLQTESFNLDDIKTQIRLDKTLAQDQKDRAEKRLDFLEKYITTDKSQDFVNNLAYGGVNIFDFRKVVRNPEDLFSIITLVLSVLSSMKDLQEQPFVFVINEAHEYFRNGLSEKLVDRIKSLIRMKRHGNNWLMLDTHFPDDVDPKVIISADVKIVHSVDKTMVRESRILSDICEGLTPLLPDLKPGQAIISAAESSEGRYKPLLVNIRQRLTKHGAATKKMTPKKK